MNNIPDSILGALEEMTSEIEALAEMVEMVGAAADLMPNVILSLTPTDNVQ